MSSGVYSFRERLKKIVNMSTTYKMFLQKLIHSRIISNFVLSEVKISIPGVNRRSPFILL